MISFLLLGPSHRELELLGWVGKGWSAGGWGVGGAVGHRGGRPGWELRGRTGDSLMLRMGRREAAAFISLHNNSSTEIRHFYVPTLNSAHQGPLATHVPWEVSSSGLCFRSIQVRSRKCPKSEVPRQWVSYKPQSSSWVTPLGGWMWTSCVLNPSPPLCFSLSLFWITSWRKQLTAQQCISGFLLFIWFSNAKAQIQRWHYKPP